MPQLKQTLAALYEQGETTESIIKTILEDLTNSEKIEQAEIILQDAEKDGNFYYTVENLVKEVVNKSDHEARNLLGNFKEEQIFREVKDRPNVDRFVIDQAKGDDYVSSRIAFNMENNIIIPAHMLDLEKRSRIQTFFENLFPYYNEQQALQLNF